MIHTKFTAPLRAEPVTLPDGLAGYRIPLSGKDGEGKFALVDPEGLERLAEAGARFLYVVGNGTDHAYVVFLAPDRRIPKAARVIAGVPKGRRVEYLNGDRFDLRTANLRIQRRKDDDWSAREVDEARDAWSAHRQYRRESERADA